MINHYWGLDFIELLRIYSTAGIVLVARLWPVWALLALTAGGVVVLVRPRRPR